MKRFFLLTGLCVFVFLCGGRARAGDGIELKLGWNGPQLEASWPARAQRADGSTAFPLFQLQRSLDLQNWVSEGSSLQGSAEAGDTLSLQLSPANAAEFFRLSARFSGVMKAATVASGGAEVFGYGSAFNEALATL